MLALCPGSLCVQAHHVEQAKTRKKTFFRKISIEACILGTNSAPHLAPEQRWDAK